ncbi:hypothetical protein QW180_25350 [Vibrio sinaloensis]|nr:hypothetical protein [Vibrio sinaloensis]
MFKDGKKNKLLDVIAQFSAQVDKESSSGEYVANTALIAKSQLTTRKKQPLWD